MDSNGLIILPRTEFGPKTVVILALDITNYLSF